MSHAATISNPATPRKSLRSLRIKMPSQVIDKQNRDMRTIAAWAAIIAVPTMIAGVYGLASSSA